MSLSGPIFEPAQTDNWKSDFKKAGAHYNIFRAKKDDSMAALRELFPDGKANELNLCLFSTSGVHGSYETIEGAEETMKRADPEDVPQVTFLVVQPRIVCTRYGNCIPKTDDDIAFLKSLRQSSWEAVQKIGAP